MLICIIGKVVECCGLLCVVICIYRAFTMTPTCHATQIQITWAAWLMRSKKSPKESQRFGSKSHTTQETGHRHIYIYIYIYNVSNPQPTAHSPPHSPQPTAHSPRPRPRPRNFCDSRDLTHTAHSPQRTAHSPQPTAHSPRPTAHSPQPTSHGPRPTAHRPRPKAYSPQPTAHGILVVKACCV